VALVLGHADLAHGHGAGRHVEQDGGLALGGGQRDAYGIGDEARVGAPERRDQRAMVGDVDEVQRDELGGLVSSPYMPMRPT
jgi:hypothetical protein